MAYVTYITDALVCGSHDRNTSDRAYLLFTREAGMVWASAKSVREERSKHRYALQDFSYARVSLVRGKRGWRVTGTEAYRNFYSDADNREARGYTRDVVRFLRRFLHGEESHPKLFDEAITALSCDDPEHREALRVVAMVRMLHLLGYVSVGTQGAVFHASSVFEALRRSDASALAEFSRAIAQAEAVSHL